MAIPDVDWRRAEELIILRLRVLEAAWNDALKRGPLGEKMIVDIYQPTFELLAPFLASFEGLEG